MGGDESPGVGLPRQAGLEGVREHSVGGRVRQHIAPSGTEAGRPSPQRGPVPGHRPGRRPEDVSSLPSRTTPGAIYSQAWPSANGNAWNTKTTLYKAAGNVAHLYENWDTTRTAPFAWLETGTGNSRTQVSYGAFIGSPTDRHLASAEADDRNYHFTGPGTEGLSDYTIRGSFKFADASAEFGINFYSQWPDEAKKYVLMRESDGLARLYYYSAAGTRTQIGSDLDTCDSSGCADNDAPSAIGVWYRYSIKVSPSGAQERVQVKVWADSLNEPSDAGIDGYNSQILNGGLVGVTTHAGSGLRYWGPITVTSNVTPEGAFLAYEDFALEDSLVDVTPFTPVSWHPDYGFGEFVTGPDSTGFILDQSGPGSLIYRHKPGVTYPVICRLIPQTNLEWRDYEFSGTIIKPADSLYDTADVGIVGYAQNGSGGYALNFTDGGVYIDGGKYNNTQKSSLVFGAGDTLAFMVRLTTEKRNGTEDSTVVIYAEAGINGATPQVLLDNEEDFGASRVTAGEPGIKLDMSGTATDALNAAQPIVVVEATVRRGQE